MRKWQVQFEGLTCASPLFKWPISTRFRYLDHLTANRMAPSMCLDPCGTGWGSWFQAILYHISAAYLVFMWSANLFKCRTNWHAHHTWRYWQTSQPELQGTVDTTDSVFSLLRRPWTWHCSHLLLIAGRARAAIYRYLLLAGRPAANPQQQQCGRQMKGQTERRTYERYIDPSLHSSQ